MSETIPALFTIPAGAPFADLLVRGLFARAGASPFALADATVLLPTRRAVRALREAFLRASEGRSLLLPRMTAIGDIDDDELLLAQDDASADIAPAISPAERLVVLTEMLRAREEVAGDPGLACRLAASLAALLDSAALEDVDLKGLTGLVRSDLAIHWQRSLDLLDVIRTAWPSYLAAHGLTDPAKRRIQLLRARAAALVARPPRGLVVAAGSTGSIPATGDLLGVIARLPAGLVVLPGLDTALDAESWAAAHEDPAHPQHGLARLLRHIGVERDAVRPWPEAPDATARVRLFGEALRPASTTPAWSQLTRPEAAAFAGLRRLEAATPHDEAVAIALVLREAIDTPGRTAALVTADRQLARRVAGELQRWDLAVDDSGGVPLLRTPAGAFLELTAAMALDPGAPIALLAALEHPFASAGLARARFLDELRRLERKALRGLRPAPGLGGLRQAARDPALRDFVDRLSALIDPFARALAAPDAAPAELLRLHAALLEALAEREAPEPSPLWAGEAGEALRDALVELGDALSDMAPIRGAQWPGLLAALLDSRVVRPRLPSHPRLAILGPLEARLQSADVVVLGGLNEGSWPPEIGDDPWLSRQMRRALGLPSPERRIGLSAHDFVQAAASAEIVLSWSRKRDAVPVSMSRWLQRLEALLGEHPPWRATLTREVGAWAASLDRPTSTTRLQPPMPRPPLAARPRRLSVSAVETWVRDPYAIYAQSILRLKPLDPIDAPPGALERGIAVHDALHRLLREAGATLPDDALERLLALGRERYADFLDRPFVRAVWWPRFERLAAWFVAWERSRRAAGYRPAKLEASGALTLAEANGFTLDARADRIDRIAEGRYAIVDYKTGRVPSGPEILAGFAPQLPLEAAIVAGGGFTDVPAGAVDELLHLRLTGGEPPGMAVPVKPTRERKIVVEPPALAAEALAGLVRLVRRFDDPATPYLSRPHVQFVKDRGAYDHLARIAEWSASGGEEP